MANKTSADLGSKKIVMLLGSTKPFPPNEYSNAASWLIQQFVTNLPQVNVQVISKWHASLEKEVFDQSKFHQVKPTHYDKLLLKIIKYIPVRIKKKIFGIVDPELILQFVGQVLILKKIQPDIVVTHFSWQLFRLAKIFTPKACHIFYFHSSNLGDLPKEFISFLFNHGDGIISICQAAFKDLESKYDALPIPKAVIYNGLDLSVFNVQNRMQLRDKGRCRLGIKDSDVVLLYAGRLVSEKGIDKILDAFITVHHEYPNLCLLIVGDEKSERFPDLTFITELREKVLLNAKESVTFLGWLPYQKMIDIYAATDISVLASNEIEGNSLFLMESMACGIPVISTDVGGVPEIVINNKTGLLVEAANVDEELGKALFSLVSSPDIRLQMGANAARHIIAHHSSQQMAEQLRSFLNTIIQ